MILPSAHGAPARPRPERGPAGQAETPCAPPSCAPPGPSRRREKGRDAPPSIELAPRASRMRITRTRLLRAWARRTGYLSPAPVSRVTASCTSDMTCRVRVQVPAPNLRRCELTVANTPCISALHAHPLAFVPSTGARSASLCTLPTGKRPTHHPTRGRGLAFCTGRLAFQLALLHPLGRGVSCLRLVPRQPASAGLSR